MTEVVKVTEVTEVANESQHDPDHELAAAKMIDSLCDKFEDSLHSDGDPSIEQFLELVEPEYQSSLLRELLILEIAQLVSGGSKLDRDSYLDRFGQFSDVVEQVFQEFEQSAKKQQNIGSDDFQIRSNDASLSNTDEIKFDSTGNRRTVAESTGPESPTDDLEQIGGYQIIEKIAAGGMGIVYKARHQKLNRLVALKTIREQFVDDDEGVNRFQLEAKAAAGLDHPGIVPVFEVAQYQNTHFYSMAFVEGESLAARLSDGPLPVFEAARLIEKVAQAIEYAHQQGVIHRDLKPGNILLDRDDQPRVTDFGLAKQIQSDSNLTATGQILGTPSYMPPEQALGEFKQISQLADVYSLGAVLYATITGRPPFQADNAMATLRDVLEKDVVSPRRLNGQIPSDMETICLKCLQKDPDRRYSSAGELAADLRRFINRESITARPVGYVEHAWRWCRRKPLVASLSLGLVLTLLVGSIVSTFFGIQSTRRAADLVVANRLAEERTLVAEARFELTLDAIDNFYTGVSEDVMLRQPELRDLRSRQLESAFDFYQRLKSEMQGATKPSQKAALAKALFALAKLTNSVGSKSEAIKGYREAIQIYQQIHRENPGSVHLGNLAVCHNNLGLLQETSSQLEAAEKSYQESISILEPMVDSQPHFDQLQHDLANSYDNLGILYQRTNKLVPAKSLHQDAIDLRSKLVERNPSEASFQSGLASSYANLGILQQVSADFLGAESSYVEALGLNQTLADRYPKISGYQRGLANSQNSLGSLYANWGRHREAEKQFKSSIVTYQKLATEYPTVARFQAGWATSCNNMGTLQRAKGDLVASCEMHQQAADKLTTLVESETNSSEFQRDLAASYNNLAKSFDLRGRSSESSQAFQKAIELYQQLVQSDSGIKRYQQELAGTYHDFALAQQASSNLVGAIKSTNRALEIRESLVKSVNSIDAYQFDLAKSYHLLSILKGTTGDRKRAESLHEKSIDLLRNLTKTRPKDPRNFIELAETLYEFGMLAKSKNNNLRAIELFEESNKFRRATFDLPVDQHLVNAGLAKTLAGLAQAQELAEMLKAAEKAYLESIELYEEIVAERPKNIAYQLDWARTWHNLAYLRHISIKDLEGAAKAYTKSIEIREKLDQSHSKLIANVDLLATSYAYIATLRQEMDDSADSILAFEKSIEYRNRLTKLNPNDFGSRKSIGIIYNTMASFQLQSGNADSAQNYYQKSIETYREARALFPKENWFRGALDNGYFQLGMLHVGQGDYREAKRVAELIASNDVELFNAAKILSASVGSVRTDIDLEEDERKKMVEQLVARSIELMAASLKSARYQRADLPAMIRNDPALNPIRGEEKFKQFVKDMD